MLSQSPPCGMKCPPNYCWTVFPEGVQVVPGVLRGEFCVSRDTSRGDRIVPVPAPLSSRYPVYPAQYPLMSPEALRVPPVPIVPPASRRDPVERLRRGTKLSVAGTTPDLPARLRGRSLRSASSGMEERRLRSGSPPSDEPQDRNAPCRCCDRPCRCRPGLSPRLAATRSGRHCGSLCDCEGGKCIWLLAHEASGLN